MTELAGYHHLFEPGTSPDAPVMLLLHGTGGDERQLLGLGRTLAPDAPLLSPRGDVVEADGVPRYFHRYPTGDGSAYPFRFDDADVTEHTAKLARFVDEACARYEVAGRPVVAIGFSNGSNIAAATMMTHPDVFRGGVLLAPMPVLDTPPSTDLSAVAAMLAAGRLDPIATPDHVERLAAALTDRGASVNVHWHDGGHDVGRTTVAAARAWLDQLRRVTASDLLP